MANEVALVSSVDHPGVIKLIEFNLSGELVVKPSGKCNQIFFIVLELVKHGDLFCMLESGAFSERVARYFFKQLVKTISYLHETAEVAHRDLKPENLLLNDNFELKIADFGLSVRNTSTHRTAVGTRRYAAPEIIEGRRYSSEEGDIFAMGVILFMMVTGCMPSSEQASQDDPVY